MGLLNWLGFGKKETKIMKYDLDPDSIKTNNIIRGLSNQVAELQGIIARMVADKSKKREIQQKVDEEEEIKTHLHEEKKQLSKKQTQKFFSLKAFFSRYLQDKNFREKLMVTTFDRSGNLAKFGDFGFSGNQFVILDNKRNIVLKMRELKDIFQSVDALPGDIGAMKIPINLDKEGGWIENLMVWEAPEIIREEDGFKYSKARKRPLYELLTEKDAQIQQGYADLEESEETNTRLQNRVDELEIVAKGNEKSGETARAERVKTAEKVSNIEKMWSDTESELAKIRQVSGIQEDEIIEIENELKRLRKKAQDEGVTLSFDEVLKRLRKTKGLFRERTIEVPEEKTQKEPQ